MRGDDGPKLLMLRSQPQPISPKVETPSGALSHRAGDFPLHGDSRHRACRFGAMALCVLQTSLLGLALWLRDVPHVLGGMAKLAAGHARAEGVVADRDGLVLELVCEVIFPFGHGTNENTYTFLALEVRDVIPRLDHGRVEAQGDLPAVWR